MANRPIFDTNTVIEYSFEVKSLYHSAFFASIVFETRIGSEFRVPCFELRNQRSKSGAGFRSVNSEPETRNLELGRRKIKYFVKRPLSIWHSFSHSIRNLVMANRAAGLCSRRIFSIPSLPRAA